MRLSKGKLTGLILVVVAVIVAGVAVTVKTRTAPAGPQETTQVTGYLGGEKISLFEDEQFRQLAAAAGLSVDYRKAGSYAMMNADTSGMDYLFPSSQAASEYGAEKGVKSSTDDIVFNTPIVVYTYRDVADALTGAGIMARNGDMYTLDVKAACDAMLSGVTWADLGYQGAYGQFKIDSTDPAKSNSGNEWAALLATVMNGGQPATADSISRDADSIRTIFDKSGWKDASSEDAFSQFLVLGKGSKPMMVGYESQALDLAANSPDTFAQVKDDLVIAYTTPTVWSTHVFMALSEEGERLGALLKSDDVQRIAWERHGFRGAGLTGTGDASAFGVTGVAQSVPASVSLPDTAAMRALLGVFGADIDNAASTSEASDVGATPGT